MRKLLLFIQGIFYCFLFHAYGQKNDSLLRLLQSANEDSSKVLLYYEYGEAMENNDSDSATYYYKKGKELAEKIGLKKGIGAFASHYIVILNNRGEFKEALKIAREALDIYKTSG